MTLRNRRHALLALAALVSVVAIVAVVVRGRRVDGSTPPSTAPAQPRADAAAAPLPSPSASTAASSSSSEPPKTFIDAAIVMPGRFTRSASDPCAGTVEGNVTDEVYAALLVPAYDQDAYHLGRDVGSVKGGDGEPREYYAEVDTASCTGHERARGFARDSGERETIVAPVAVTTWPMPSSEARAADADAARGADDSRLVRVEVASTPHICGSAGYGFLATVHRTGNVVRVGAVTSWQSDCDDGAPGFMTVAGRPAITEVHGLAEGVLKQMFVWVPFDRRLVRVGEILVGLEDVAADSMERDRSDRSAVVEGSSSGLVAIETTSVTARDGGAVHTTAQRIAYVLRGETLVELRDAATSP